MVSWVNLADLTLTHLKHLVSLQPGGPADVAALVTLLELAPPLLVVHQLVVPPLGRLVGEGDVAGATEVLPDVPLHVVPVRVDLDGNSIDQISSRKSLQQSSEIQLYK